MRFAEVLEKAPQLEWLQICASGVDRPLYRTLSERGVRLTNAAGVNASAVAQSAVAGMLALARAVPQWVKAQREHRWQPLRGDLTPSDLADGHAVVVGTGAIGAAIARALRAFDMRVTGIRRSREPHGYFDQILTFDQLDRVMPVADWIILACPLTDATLRLIDARRLRMLSPSAKLVNVARGAVLDEEALIQALQEERLSGAYLDVFTTEPLSADSPLWDMERVLISSHSAGSFVRHQEKLMDLFIQNLSLFLEKSVLRNETLPTS